MTQANEKIGVYAIILAFISHVALALIFKSLIPFYFVAGYIIFLFAMDDLNGIKKRRK